MEDAPTRSPFAGGDREDLDGISIDAKTEQVFRGLCDHTLPKAEWTHEAHLRVCWAALATRDADEAIDFLRTGIRSYNEATGVANTPTSGYHETITQYFVITIDALKATSVSAVLDSPYCATTSPLDYWSSETLMSSEARARWVEPDQVTSSRSTTKTRVSFGAITPPAPAAP